MYKSTRRPKLFHFTLANVLNWRIELTYIKRYDWNIDSDKRVLATPLQRRRNRFSGANQDLWQQCQSHYRRRSERL